MIKDINLTFSYLLMQSAGRVRVHISVNNEIYEKFLERLRVEGWHNRSVSEVVELLMRWYVEGEISDERLQKSGTCCITDKVKSVINILEERASEGIIAMSEREIKMTMLGMGIISHREMSQILKSLIRTGVLKPAAMYGNSRAYRIIPTSTAKPAIVGEKDINLPATNIGVGHEHPDNVRRVHEGQV
jgi:hypothetical protein